MSKTEIVFEFPTSGLCRLCFYHPDSPLHNAANDKERRSALMYSDYEISTENLIATDEYLQIPLHFGWTEKATYFKEKLIEKELLYNDGVVWQRFLIERNLSWFDKAGCLISFFAWPILYIHDRLVRRRLIRNNPQVRTTTSHILPMIQQKDASPEL